MAAGPSRFWQLPDLNIVPTKALLVGTSPYLLAAKSPAKARSYIRVKILFELVPVCFARMEKFS